LVKCCYTFLTLKKNKKGWLLLTNPWRGHIKFPIWYHVWKLLCRTS
jgi:hypothetical protein